MWRGRTIESHVARVSPIGHWLLSNLCQIADVLKSYELKNENTNK